MVSKEARRTLLQLLKGKVLFDEPMKNHTSLLIGGSADALIVPKNVNDLKCLLGFAKRGIPIVVMGNGTKLLVSDGGIEGIVIKICGCFDNVTIHQTKVTVGAGYLISKLSRTTADRGLSGLEFAVCIPGTVGGAVVMNAGAHGSTISDVLTCVTAMNLEGEISRYSKEDIDYGDRRSSFQNNRLIVLSAEMSLRKDNLKEIRRRMRQYIQWRKRNQPLDWPNAGSIFKNPIGTHAGELIDKAGLKGMRLGDAKISEKRANFIINLGNATESDVMKLIGIIEEKVSRDFGIRLEREIRVIDRLN